MNYKVKEIPMSERPRERMKEIGKEALSDKELLSIILKTGTKDKTVTDLALDILQKYPLKEFLNLSLEGLKEIKGVGEVKALELLAIVEFGKRIFIKKGRKLKTLRNALDIYWATKYLFISVMQEQFYALYFNTKKELLATKLLFKGTVNESIVHPREIFKEAYRLSATYIICLHNHPSNDTTPSAADISFTSQLMETGKIQGIKVVDHIIVGMDNFYSFYENKKTYIQEDS